MNTIKKSCWLVVLCGAIALARGDEIPIGEWRDRFQPVTWLGQGIPSESEVLTIKALLEESVRPQKMQALAVYLEASPNSPWAASLESYYATLCKRRGFYTRALRHFESAWAKSKHYTSGPGKVVGDFTLAHWTQLLASLGRAERLHELFRETDGRSLEGPGAQLHFDNAKEGLYTMVRYPEVSFRCGTFALTHVARALGRTNFNRLLDVRSPTNGFSITKLLELCETNDLALVAVQRPPGATLITPCVVHWKQNHFAAILGRDGDLCWVADPTFDKADWMHISAIEEEASGSYLIPKAKKPADWRLLHPAETDRLFGKGQPNNVSDWKDEGCDKSPEAKGAPCKDSCPPCSGLATWWVTEPYINLLLADEPLAYTTTHGEQMPFRWTYKQRDVYPFDYNIWLARTYSASRTKGMTNASFAHNWLSTIRYRDTYWDANPGSCPLTPNYTYYEAIVHLPTGGSRYHAKTVAGEDLIESRSKVRLEPMSGTGRPTYAQPTAVDGIVWGGDSTHGFRLVYPNGSQEIYNVTLKPFSACDRSSQIEAVLTKRVDQFGRTNLLGYESVPRGDAQPYAFRVKYIVDYDGRTNTLRYSSAFPELVAEVEDPWGRKAQIQYDDSSGRLTNIVDAVGLSSSFAYQGTNGWITTLTTPYGSTAFTFYEAPSAQPGYADQGNMGGHDRINRTVEITDPLGAKQLYMYRYELALLPSSYPASEVPTGVPLILDNGGSGTAGVSFRNSFYWGRKQYAALSTTTHADFTASDYQKGRLKHWLDSDSIQTVSDRISIQRDPSPDGALEGQKTWYSYSGKDPAAPHRVGSQALSGLIARVLPDGTTQYTDWVYTSAGFPDTSTATFTKPDGSVGTRTRWFVYASNGIDLVQEFGPDETGSATLLKALYGYNGFHQLTKFTNAASEVTTLSYDAINRKLTNIVWPGGLTTRLSYYPLTTTRTDLQDFIKRNAGFLNEIYDVEIGALTRFTYTNGLVLTNTDPRGLKTVYAWDGLQRPLSVTYPDGTYISNHFDKLDVVGVIDRLGNWTHYRYDARRQLTSVTNALTNVTAYGYCGCGALENITNALGQVTTFTYDNQLRRTSVILPNSTGTINYRYDALGRVTNLVDNANNVFTISYNNQSLPILYSNGAGTTLNVVYDHEDRPIRVTDAAGVTITNSFDRVDRLVSRAFPDGGIELLQHSATGITAFTNQLARSSGIPMMWPAG